MTQTAMHESLDLSIADSEVVRRVLAGETELFEIIMRRYNQRLYRATRAILGDEVEAEQVMQDAYVLAYTNLAQFAEKAKFSTWLTRIAVNEALGHLRRRSRFVDIDSVAESEKGKRMLSSAERTPEQKVLNSELRNLLEKAVDGLPEHYRSVLVMRDVEGLDTAETAECLAISEETVKVRLHRARGLMRKLWEEHIVYTRNYIISGLASLGDFGKVAERLLSNQDDIGNAIKPFYGEEAGKKLSALLRDHILIAVDIVSAAKAGNNEAVTKGEKKRHENADEIATYLSGANPNWPKGSHRHAVQTPRFHYRRSCVEAQDGLGCGHRGLRQGTRPHDGTYVAGDIGATMFGSGLCLQHLFQLD